MRARLCDLTLELMSLPGLSGYEGRVRKRIVEKLDEIGLTHRTDRLGNLIATIAGDPDAPSVMLFAHMDQLGMVVRAIEPNGFLRVERLGGVPERALPAQSVIVQIAPGRDVPGVIANKSHHATSPDEKYRVVPYQDLYIDIGVDSAAAAENLGVRTGSPIVYAPAGHMLGAHRIAGPAVDDRAGCAVVLETARLLSEAANPPTTHIVFSVQEEFNLRGVMPAVNALSPDIAIQIDLVLATDAPDMTGRGDVRLGGGPAMSMYSFHGRGTLNGLIPHPALVDLFDRTAGTEKIPLQRSAHVGALTETSYVQLAGDGVACIDMGFPMRYSHSSVELCDARDLEQLVSLLAAAIRGIGPDFSLDPDRFEQ